MSETPLPHDETLSPVCWVAAVSITGELAVPATDGAASLRATAVHLRREHTKRLTKGDVPPDAGALDQAVERDLALFETGCTLSGSAPTLAKSFRVYQVKANLTPREAMRRWRSGFPRAGGCALQDPLREIVRRLEAPEQPTIPKPIQA